MIAKIFVTTRFECFHQWPDAPEEVGFLQFPHRHLFYVRAEWKVNHDDRDLEFFIQKKKLNDYIQTMANSCAMSTSCEMFARSILNTLNCCRVEVSEDNENGAIVEEDNA